VYGPDIDNPGTYVGVMHIDLAVGCQHLAICRPVWLGHHPHFGYIGDDLAHISLDEMLTEQGFL